MNQFVTYVFLLIISFSIFSCNSKESSVSSVHAAKLLDQALVDELQKMREESNSQIHQFESRLPELTIMINEVYFMENAELRTKYQGVSNAMMELLQTKNHYDMERNMFVDKMLNSLSNATSKDEVRKNSLMHIDELRNQGQLYLNSYQKLLAELQKAKIETPIIEELMKAAPHVDGAMNEAGDVNAHQ
ncbi:MAG: hypothetical protein HYZ16_05520 [Bacteroidetes bacterium]|nr:hypothetical protein [Bacteroidota bacterium]